MREIVPGLFRPGIVLSYWLELIIRHSLLIELMCIMFGKRVARAKESSRKGFELAKQSVPMVNGHACIMFGKGVARAAVLLRRLCRCKFSLWGAVATMCRHALLAEFSVAGLQSCAQCCCGGLHASAKFPCGALLQRILVHKSCPVTAIGSTWDHKRK